MALKDVLIDELRDMYSAENQLVKALPKLARGANSPKLKILFAAHLEETKAQVERLKRVFNELGEKPTGQHCNGMEGVIEEGKDALEKDEEGPLSTLVSSEQPYGPSTMKSLATRLAFQWRAL